MQSRVVVAGRRSAARRPRSTWAPSTPSVPASCAATGRASACPPTFVIFDNADQESLVRQALKEINLDRDSTPPGRVLERHLARQERAGPGRGLPGHQLLRRDRAPHLPALPGAAAREQRPRLRRPAGVDRPPAARATTTVRQDYRRRFRTSAGRRVPGHQHRSSTSCCACSAGRRRPVRRRRRGPVDLPLARRRLPQRAALPEGLPRPPADPARAELPLHPDRPGRRHGRHRPPAAAARASACSPTAARARRSSCTRPTTKTTKRPSSSTRSPC